MKDVDNILITGCAGFIGFSVSRNLLKKGIRVIGVDNLNKKNFFIKKKRLLLLYKYKNFKFLKLDIGSKKFLTYLNKKKFQNIIHLAAIPGVLDSIKNPKIYFKNNIEKFFKLLTNISKSTKNFIFASSSSVYGNNINQKENQNTDMQLNFYGGSKKINEIIAYSLSHQFKKTKFIGLRFFTVYGPWGRPDMAVYKFAEKITKGEMINLHNYGNHKRDFTYVDDVTEAIYLIIKNSDKLNRYQIFNIARGKSENIKKLIHLLETCLNGKAKISKIKIQEGEMINTFSKSNLFCKKFNFRFKTNLESGIRKFSIWFKNYEKNNKIFS